MLNRKPQTEFIALLKCRPSSSMKQTRCRLHHTKQSTYVQRTRHATTNAMISYRISFIRIYIYKYNSTSVVSTVVHSVPSANPRPSAEISAPRNLKQCSLVQTSLYPAKHTAQYRYLCTPRSLKQGVASTDVMCPRNHTAQYKRLCTPQIPRPSADTYAPRNLNTWTNIYTYI